MHEFSVWAPSAKSIEVQLGAARLPLQHSENGWWRVTSDRAGPGTLYSFVLDGGEPVPDPRSPWQPQGIHGPSCVVDHSAFPWTDAKFQARPLPSAAIYEIHPGTFTPQGTFDTAIDRLDYLADLGVTHLELMPANEFSGKWGWGYDGVDLYAPHNAYGGPDALKRLVDAAHGRGLAVLLDVVYNHLGPAGNYLSRFGPYFTQRHRTPWGEAVNLDGPHSDQVRRFFIDNALMWLRDYHLDGLRIDAVHALVDGGATHFLEQLATEVERQSIQLGRHVSLIAESDLNDPRIVRPREMGGYGIHAQWNDDFHHAVHSVLTGEHDGYYRDFGAISDLAKSLRDVFVYDGTYSAHRHRAHGRPVGLLPGYHFLGYIQNHDQVGNRARGERIGQLVGVRKARIAAGVVLTAPFIPMIFQGEEWAASTPFQYFTSHGDAHLGEAVSQGRRGEFVEFGWGPDEVPDPQDPATFENSRLRWEEITQQPHAEMLEWYRSLLRLRREHADLADGNLEAVRVRCDDERQWLAYRRGSLTMVCNFAAEAQCIPCGDMRRVLLCSSEDDPRFTECGVALAPESFAVLSR